MKALSAQHQETAAYITRRMDARQLAEPERAAFCKLLRAQAAAWKDAGGAPAEFAGAELLGVLAQADQPAAPAPAAEPEATKAPRKRGGR